MFCGRGGHNFKIVLVGGDRQVRGARQGFFSRQPIGNKNFSTGLMKTHTCFS